MDRYKEKDKKEAEENARMQLNGDPSGGINTIALASLKRDQPEDNKEISELAYDYMTGAKDSTGIPNGQLWLQEYHANLAARNLISQWTQISEGALDKFMNNNFKNVWNRWDVEKVGHIDETQIVPFMRELLTAEQKPLDINEDESNPYKFDIVGGKIVLPVNKGAVDAHDHKDAPAAKK